ncbi:NAD(P)-binding protein [Polychaeton citri CBS 116435]|uniref:NAD(P)-binding protein n=1 Tax=Polychaeton citri CBS 116435 TaxID=1314669 RepID=A0A9P4QG64_9PEZI|nr:NAD(P)-binding protein [Polychaeton citri CBS 116435]
MSMSNLEMEACSKCKTWLVIGASRGIGHEFARHALARGDNVLATVRDPSRQTAVSLWPEYHERCTLFACDVLSELSIDSFVESLSRTTGGADINHVVVNAGVLKYPNRATEISYEDFAFHLHTNTIGPIICAQRVLKAGIPVESITFVSSDSGSAASFRDFEDGFAAYGASKAALNQMLRHMAAELKRRGSQTIILALHPGEVATDMANVDLGWEVEGQMTPEESVSGCIKVIESKTLDDTGTFWTWDNEQYPW